MSTPDFFRSRLDAMIDLQHPLADHEKKLLKRRQAIEPLIGHTKADHRMDRCWLQGAVGDALHALSCAAGYNIRWLLRAIARLAARRLFCALFERVLWVRISGAGLASAWMRAVSSVRMASAQFASFPVSSSRATIAVGQV